MNKHILIGAVVIIVVALGGWWVYSQNTVQAPTQTQTQTQTENQVPTTATPKTYEIIYTDSGYSPSTLTINVGDTVTWKNESSGGDWVGSAMHPTHTAYSGTSLQQHCPDPSNTAFDECKADKPGESWSFTFTKAGTWGYHNHVNSRFFGKITVQ